MDSEVHPAATPKPAAADFVHFKQLVAASGGLPLEVHPAATPKSAAADFDHLRSGWRLPVDFL